MTNDKRRDRKKGTMLYLIALVPDEEISQEITEFKLECSRLFDSSHALKVEPHITLIPPLRLDEDKLKELNTALKDFSLTRSEFQVDLDGFDSFEPRVLFVKVIENLQLEELQKALFEVITSDLAIKDKRGERFHPHLTLAHKDLEKEMFYKGLEHFSKKKYKKSFKVKGITLFVHKNRRWEAMGEFPFQKELGGY